jgi:hypothetical protein
MIGEDLGEVAVHPLDDIRLRELVPMVVGIIDHVIVAIGFHGGASFIGLGL